MMPGAGLYDLVYFSIYIYIGTILVSLTVTERAYPVVQSE